ncbi:MAG: hypothetical protein PW788_00555 [Micavibrio sp.]|nr:hypothetical protein [Micavibrio sp.]
MKKYLTIAAILGIIAFASVSFLAQADESAPKHMKVAAATAAADPSDGEAAADNADAATSNDAAPAKGGDTFEADHDTCAASSTALKGDDGKDASAEKIAAAYTKCMHDMGHNDDELKAHAAEGEEDTGAGKTTGSDE